MWCVTMARRSWLWMALVALQALCGVARAQEVPPAIGRISYGASAAAGAAVCTGALVAPDLVLTAGHCLRSVADHPGSIHFVAGLADGKGLATRRGRMVILADPAPAGRNPIAGDLALLRLDAPIPANVVPPLALADVAGDRFTLIAYRRDQPQSAVRQDDCTLNGVIPGLLGLNCAVVSGNSGAPLLAWDGEAWVIVAVMVAANNTGPVRAWAAIPQAGLRRQIIP
jgi:protease YdgD